MHAWWFAVTDEHATTASALSRVQRQVRMAARATARHGLAHAYGHCSQRLDERTFLVCAPRPMGLVSVGDRGVVVPVDKPLPHGVLGEVRIHQKIYASRPDVAGIVRAMPPALMALGTARRIPRPRHGMGAYFHNSVVLWDDPQLLRNGKAATDLAGLLGQGNAVIMRGNGTVVAADDLPAALVLLWYLEDAARLELELLSAGLEAESVVLDESQCARRATRNGAIFERMWEYLTAGDPENT